MSKLRRNPKRIPSAAFMPLPLLCARTPPLRYNKKAGLSPGLSDTLYKENSKSFVSMRRRRHAPCQPHTV